MAAKAVAFILFAGACGGVTSASDAGSDASKDAGVPAQAGIVVTVQPDGNGDACNTPSAFMTINDPNGPVMPVSGDSVSCTIVPKGADFDVTAVAQSAAGTLNISGMFSLRPRDSNGTPTADGTFVMPAITVDLEDGTKHLRQSDCTVRYLTVVNGAPGVSLPSEADVFADDKGGRVWASVFCPAATNVSVGNPDVAECNVTATFRFENCASQ